MGDYEIDIDDSTSRILAAIRDVGDEDVLSLARTAEIDPEEFRMFLAEYGETENQDAQELLKAAEFLRFGESDQWSETYAESLSGAVSQKRERIWLKYLFIGGGIGAILGLIFAPRRGYELRGDIADATRKGIDRSREAAKELRKRASEYYQATSERPSELNSQAAEKVGETAQAGRERTTRKSSTIAEAIDAGKRAYQDEKRKSEMSSRSEAAPTYGEETN